MVRYLTQPDVRMLTLPRLPSEVFLLGFRSPLQMPPRSSLWQRLGGVGRLLPVVWARLAGVILGRWLQMRDTMAQLPTMALTRYVLVALAVVPRDRCLAGLGFGLFLAARHCLTAGMLPTHPSTFILMVPVGSESDGIC